MTCDVCEEESMHLGPFRGWMRVCGKCRNEIRAAERQRTAKRNLAKPVLTKVPKDLDWSRVRPRLVKVVPPDPPKQA